MSRIEAVYAVTPNAKFSGLSVAKLRWNVELGEYIVLKKFVGYAAYKLSSVFNCFTQVFILSEVSSG